ncbi:hypothetical protein DSO57_1006488 [Entomophthora muscae]|uniref:Uncharacterized protein n=1 Tax=Entomophthora muscae TaxID=34485 RepID=A0ACC2RMG3_9FUNG|nr:hypothetical protein DSO57_1006488 [Entomophthora muscae]
MTPPLTPRLDLPMEPSAVAETTSTQLFGHQFYGGLYPLAWPYPILSHLMPLPMPGFLAIGDNNVRIDNYSSLETWAWELKSNPKPRSLQAAWPVDRLPAFFWDQALTR